MRTFARISLLAAASLTLVACGRPAETATEAPAANATANAAARKCPDENIRDNKDPCSVFYVPPHKPAFKGDKGL